VDGAALGAYRLIRRIGAGGMGEVWLAEHTLLGRKAAIKVLHPMYSASADIVARFFNEARAATAIADPGIVQIYDFGHAADGSAYIVMELLEGETLDARLSHRGAMSIADALRILKQVASSLGAAHARGIVHRDLKPENIFLVRDPEVPGGERAKILDFGIAKLSGDAGSKTMTSAVMGTPMFMSPEQCRGAGGVDQRADIYSLGCVLFTLLCARPVFEAVGVGELIALHLTAAPPRASSCRAGIPVEIDDLIARCLDKDPARRFASGSELATSLGELAARDLVTPEPPRRIAVHAATMPTTISGATGVTSPPTTAPKRHGLALGAIGTCVLALAIGLAIKPGAKRDDPPAPHAATLVVEQPTTPPIVAPAIAPEPPRATRQEAEALLAGLYEWATPPPAPRSRRVVRAVIAKPALPTPAPALTPTPKPAPPPAPTPPEPTDANGIPITR
jgi:serine/threonine-protein kinase